MQTISKIKLLLDVDNHDELLSIYLDNAKDFTLDYTGLDKIPSTLESLVIEMVVYQYRQRGLENISSETMGAMSHTFITEYPNNIMDRLDKHVVSKKVTVV